MTMSEKDLLDLFDSTGEAVNLGIIEIGQDASNGEAVEISGIELAFSIFEDFTVCNRE